MSIDLSIILVPNFNYYKNYRCYMLRFKEFSNNYLTEEVPLCILALRLSCRQVWLVRFRYY